MIINKCQSGIDNKQLPILSWEIGLLSLQQGQIDKEKRVRTHKGLHSIPNLTWHFFGWSLPNPTCSLFILVQLFWKMLLNNADI